MEPDFVMHRNDAEIERIWYHASMPDGNAPLPNVPLDSPLDPPSTGVASSSQKITSKGSDDSKKKRQRAEETFTDGKEFLLFESAIAGIEADARQKGGLSKFDVAIIRNLQRSMLAIGQKFVKRGTEDRKKSIDAENSVDPGTGKIDDWQRISKGIESTLAVKPDFDETATEYVKAGNGYKKNLLYAAKKDLQKGAERSGNIAETSSGQREKERQENILLARGRSFLRRPAYTDRMSEETAEQPPVESETGGASSTRIVEAVKNTEPVGAGPQPEQQANPEAEGAEENVVNLTEDDILPDDDNDADADATNDTATTARPSEQTDTGAASVIASLGAPIAVSVVGAIAAKKAESLFSSSTTDEAIASIQDAPESAEKTAVLERILQELDAQEEALHEKTNAAASQRSSRRIDSNDIQERIEVGQELLKIEQKRLELLKTHQTLPGVYASIYDAQTLEENLQRALAEIDDAQIALVRKQYQETAPQDQVEALEKLFQELERAKVIAAGSKSATAANSPTQQRIAELRQQIEMFQAQHPISSSVQSTTTVSRSPIDEVRTELRRDIDKKTHQAEILETYSVQMREKSLTYLASQHPQLFAQYQTLQTQTTTVTIDATSFLNPAELQNVQLEVFAQLKTTYPEISNELISALLLAKSAALLERTEALEKQATLATVAAFLGGSVGMAPGAIATRLAPMAMGLLNEMRATGEALRAEERGILDRARQIQTMTTIGAPTDTNHAASVTNVRNEQQRSFARRQGLQAKLHGQVAALGALQSFGSQNIAGDSVTEPANTYIGLLEQSGHAPHSVPPPLPTTREVISSSSTAPALSIQTNSGDNLADVNAHQAAIASKLTSNQVRDQRLGAMSQSAQGRTASSGTASYGSSAEDAPPLLSLPVKPTNPREKFARDQQDMINRTRSLVGGAAETSGFEGAFSENDGSEQGLTSTEQWSDSDDIEEIDPEEEQNDQTTEGEDEAHRQSQIMQQQQQAARAQETQSKQQNLADGVKKLSESPAGKKAMANAGKLLANPATAVILVVVIAIWLNIRLILPKEGSLIRKPLGGLGKMGTILLDILLVIFIMNALVVMVIIIILPFLPILLPLGAAFAILQRAVHLFGG